MQNIQIFFIYVQIFLNVLKREHLWEHLWVLLSSEFAFKYLYMFYWFSLFRV